ncbi:unnamed protein product, partial [Mesorhabditis spiculigera]
MDDLWPSSGFCMFDIPPIFVVNDGGQTSNIVTEYCPRGDLRKFINDKDQRYSISLVIDWACQIFDTLVYLEKERIYHRDIKPANMLLGENCEIKLCDFGLSKSEITENSCYTVSGTMRYMPPETFDTIDGEQIYTYASDLYSAGIVLWECIERRAVFGNINKTAILFARICLVKDPRCVRRVPEDRPAAAKALEEASGLKNEPFYAEFCTRLYWLELDSKNTLLRPVDGRWQMEPTLEQLEVSAELVPAEFPSEYGFELRISQMMNILHSPIFRGVLSKTHCWFSLDNDNEYPSEMAVYEWAGVWKKLVLWGNRLRVDGINCSSFVIRNIQKLLNEGTSEAKGLHLHDGPWHFPFIGDRQMDFEEKYNVRIVLITPEDGRRYLSIFHCNKPDTFLSLLYQSNRCFNISMRSPYNIDKYEQMQLGIIAKDEAMKVTSEKINEWTYKRTMEPETGWKNWETRIWTANYRPTFDDINCFDYLKGPLPDMSYCREFDEMC